MVYKTTFVKLGHKRVKTAFIPATPGVRKGKSTRFTKKVFKPLDTQFNNALARKIRMATDPMGEYQREISKFTKNALVADIKGTKYQKIIGPAMSGADEGEPQALISNEDPALKAGRGTIGQGRTYKSYIHTGFPTTKVVKLGAKMNGVTNETYSDTELAVVTEADREHLTRAYGFNQKMVWNFDTLGYWTLSDIYNIYGGSNYKKSNQDQTVYADSHFFGTRYRIRNVNNYLRSKVKIHLVRQVEKSLASKSLFAYGTFNQDTNVQEYGRIPINRQLNALNTNSLAGGFNTDIDPRAHATNSPKNRGDWDVVKSYTKILNPGEEWFFDHKHHTGPGMRMDKIVTQYNEPSPSNDSAPFFYYYIEAVGLPCEAILGSNHLIRNSGTAPGAIHVEMKKYFRTGLASENAVYNQDTFAGGFFRSDYGYRIFSKANPGYTITQKIFNVDSTKIKDIDATGAGEYYIPVVSDMTVRGGALEK